MPMPIYSIPLDDTKEKSAVLSQDSALAKSYQISMDLSKHDGAVNFKSRILKEETKIYTAMIQEEEAETESYHIPINNFKESQEDILLDYFATSKLIRTPIQQSCALEKIICLSNGLTMIWAPYTFISSVTKVDEIVPSRALAIFAVCLTLIIFIMKTQTHYLQLHFTSDVMSMGRNLLVSLLQIPLVSYILFSLTVLTPMDLLLHVILLLFIILECIFCVVEIRREWKHRQYERRNKS